jgi:sec-independent protein translocase protein TatA
MGLGMPEVILILVVALIVFGPRKLPDLGKSLGQAMLQFRRASEDFKRTWEQEVEFEKGRKPDSDNSNYGYLNSSSDPYPTESHSYENPRNEAVYSTHAAESGSVSNTESSQSVQVAGNDAATAEPAAATTAHAPEKKHWI